MKHVAPETFETRQPLPAAAPPTARWWQGAALWWQRAGWDRTALPETLRRDVEGDHPRARPIRGQAEWERRL